MMGRSHFTTNICTVISASVGLSKLSEDMGLVPIVHNFWEGLRWADVSHKISNIFLPDGMSYFWILAYVPLFLLGTLLPDADSRTSMMGRYLYIPVKHRTWTHSIYFLAPLIALSFLHTSFLWLMAGYFLHLFWDSPSACGVAWFRPVTGYKEYPGGAKVKKGHKLKLYKADSVSEYVFVIVILLVTCFLATSRWLLPLFGVHWL